MTDHGLDPAVPHEHAALDDAELQRRREALGELFRIAQAEMETLYDQIAGSGYVILLTDSTGVITTYIGDPALDKYLPEAGVVPGGEWSEAYEGTNGMGTCLVEKRPVIVHKDDHFDFRHTGLTCSAAPIFSPEGELAAVLDASSTSCQDSKQSQFHTMALVNMSAKLIENRTFLSRYRDQRILSFHSRREFVGLPTEAMLAMDADGQIVGANANAVMELGHAKHETLLGQSVSDVLNVTLAALEKQAADKGSTVSPLSEGPYGHSFFAVLKVPEAAQPTSIPATKKPAPGDNTPALNSRTLACLVGDDPQVAYNVRCIKRVLDKDINVMLCGETGTGKEAFAQAIHAASPRANWPFVALNCASIPETLIESELFGYRRGAFTGARREGMRGKVLQADGGTLFLDEVGDMPLDLQPRLLRVLEEREVLPLGSETPIRVDLHIISASHYDLREQVRRGAFREDLYYRLDGLVLNLPPLRERTDKEALIKQLLMEESQASEQTAIEPTALRKLLEYPWPGNIRELRNVLRTAIALSDGGVIHLADLPKKIALFEAARQGDDQQLPLAEAPTGDETTLEFAERDALLMELERNRWNVTATAAKLKMSRSTVYRKLKRHGI